ncbi:hypothetical protein ACEN9F_12685 [Duganella sp. CT11-25]|uniref:hypothetical protein n=1 Tax=unclassified Duganella TaxID=2636909 RepID=UPI0039AF1576
MEFSKLSTRKLIVASAAIGAVVVALGAWFANSAPAEPHALPAPVAAPASASSSASAKKAAPAAAAPRAVADKEPAPPSEPAATRSKEQAAAALMALPELQAWSALLEKNSNGKVHGALIEYDPTPRKLNGKNYWQFSYVENSAEAAQRWESFLVSSSDDEILVEDASTDEVISLARWRREKHPAKRTSIDG